MASVDEFMDLVERRKFRRVSRQVAVRCKRQGQGEGEPDAKTMDISAGGVRLMVRQKLHKGESLDLTFRDEQHDIDLSLTGQVAWISRNVTLRCFEVGVKFHMLTQEELDKVVSLIAAREGGSANERRRLIRLDAPLEVRVYPFHGSKDKGEPARAVDLGLGGMALDVRKVQRKNVPCFAEILLPDDSEPVRVKATVLEVRRRRHETHIWRVRLRFEAFEGDGHRRLGHFLCEEALRRLE